MSKAFLLDIFRTIRHSKSRFISIIIIVALGAGFFVGIKSTGPSMSTTATEYFNENNLMDIRIQSAIGLTDSDVKAISEVSGVSGVMPQKFIDALVLVNGVPEIDIDGSQISTRAYGINLSELQEYYYGIDNKDFLNRPTLIDGTYPTKTNQCLVDESALSTPDSYKIGSVIMLQSDANTDLSVMNETQFEIVGIIRSPQYVSFERGNSLVGSGKIGTFIYIPDSAFSTDYYSEIYAKVEGADKLSPYSEEYENLISSVTEKIEVVAKNCVAERASSLKTTLPSEITAAEIEYEKNKKEVTDKLSNAKEQLELYRKYAEDPEKAYNDAVNQAASALGIAESEFNGSQAEYFSAVETYNKNLEDYKNAREQQQAQYAKLTDAESKYNNAQSTLIAAESTVNNTQQLVTSTESVISSADTILVSLQDYQNGKMNNEQLSQILSTLEGINPELYASVTSLSAVSMATEAIALISPYLEQQKSQLAIYQNQLNNAKKQLDEYSSQFQQAALILNAAKAAYDQADSELDAAYDQLNNFYNELEGSKSELSSAQIELMLNQNSVTDDLNSFKALLSNADEYLKTAESEYNAAKTAAESELAAAENKIADALALYKKLDTAKWNIYDRGQTPGYSSYESAVNNVKVLANIFPLIFFFVAALVCFTTMSRMIEEERTQMGTMKALGYSTSAITAKYIIYALFASIIGAALGIVSGIYLLPFAIFKAYSIMFTLPPLTYTFPVSYILSGLLISSGTTLIASLIAAFRELQVNPASLMRPKSPKSGKRILLEYLTFIWKRISFTGKVTARNLFRRKGRGIMTVVGIGGCTALILASCGLYTSINGLMAKQYDKNGVAAYDFQIVFSGQQTADSAVMQALNDDSRISSIMLSSIQSVTGGSDYSEKTEDIYLFVPKSAQKLSEYISLKNRVSNQKLTLDNTGAIVTEKFASDTNVEIGDKIWVDSSDGEKIYIPIAAITENYTFSYVYLSEDLYQYLFQKPVEYNYAIGTVEPSFLNDNGEKKAMLATELMTDSRINAVAYSSDTVDTLNKVINVLSAIILIFIIAAGLLAFIVLYNLSNINISERQRELATIKVLGFHDKEVSAYIYRENIFLTVFGIIFGLFAGIFVHKVLLIYCSVDTVMYVQDLSWICYLIATALMILFAVTVNLIMHKKMMQIDMVESLKAIE